MNSFWSKFSSRNFFKSARNTDREDIQATSDIGDTPAEPPTTPRSEEASTPASFLYTPTAKSTISEISEFRTPDRAYQTSPVDENRNADYFEEHLRKLKAMEAIEIIQRRRSLHLSELESNQKADPSLATLCETLAASNTIMSQSQALLAASTSTIAKTQKIAAEKELNENIKLKSLESEDIIQFLAKLNPRSCQPIWKQVPTVMHDSLALDLQIPLGETIASYFGDELGPDSLFVEALKALVASRPNIDPKILLRTHAMPEKAYLDRTALLHMLAVTQRDIMYHPKIYNVLSLV
jgi:hypothetical protein